jgi:hypothetical protein
MRGKEEIMQSKIIYLRLVLMAFVSSILLYGSMAMSVDQDRSQTTGSLPLLQLRNLVYQGAFRVPSGQFGRSVFDYGGTAPAYNPMNDSLFIVGHDWDQLVAEIKIPKIINSTRLNDLSTATVLQPFADASQGLMYTVGTNTIKIGGLMVYGGKLYGTAYVYYDAAGTQILSHFISPLNLSLQGAVRGILQVGNMGAGFVSGYMALIPPEWQSSLVGPAITGQCCIPIISRSSYGPAAFVFDPGNLGGKNSVPDTPLVYYPSSNPLAAWDATSSYFNGTSSIRGLIFPRGTRSILFIGRQGIGTFCYGTGGSSGGECYDPADSSKGNHAYPYVYQIWAYDILDLITVKNGKKQPWQVKPYALWNFNLPFESDNRQIGGATYDQANQRLFISQINSDGTRPVIHLFMVTGLVTP